MKKIFTLAALALTLAACNKQEVQPVGQNDGMITLTAMLDPKGAATKAIAEDGNTIKADWAQNEQLAILYEVGGAKKYTPATVTSVDAVTGAATIEFTVASGTADGTPCRVVYPLRAYSSATDVKSNADLIGNQPGTLDAKLDVRVTTGRISPVNPAAGLVLDTPLAPKFAIVKFSLRHSDSSPLSARSLAVTIGAEAFVATPASARSEFYLALPAVSDGTLIFSVPGDAGTSSYCSSKTNITIEAGKYYRSTVQMEKQSEDAKYVPMGDGLNWALKNIGASSPADYGAYFAWGEISVKTAFTWATYKWANGAENKLTKYCFTTDYWDGSGSPDNILKLESGDDAATQSMDWGSSWRTPTHAEWEALVDESNFTRAWVNNFNGSGKNGRLVISKKSGFEGNCIFLPAAGVKSNEELKYSGNEGWYWSSTVRVDPSMHALNLQVSSSSEYDFYYTMRYLGCSVRPVLSVE